MNPANASARLGCAVLACSCVLLSRSATASGQGATTAPTATPPTTAPSGTEAPPAQRAQREIQDIELLELEVPIVVTAGRIAQPVNTVPYAMSVITQEDIRRSGARSVPDALRLVPGVDVAELSYGNYAVSPRGFQGFYSNKVLVLVDGRQIFDPLFGGTMWGNWPFQLEDIKQIEVLRGPAGVIWGSNAVNGVINIITKDPRDQVGATLLGGGGTQGMNKEYAGYGFEAGKVRMRVSGEFEGSDGFQNGGSLLAGLHDDYHDIRSSLYAIVEPNPHDTWTISGGSSVLSGNWPLSRFPGQRYLQPQGRADFALARWEHRIEKDNTLELTGYVNDFYVLSGVPWSDVRYQQYALQLRHTFRAAENHTLTWGVDTRFDVVNTSGADPYMLTRDLVQSSTYGAYIQDEWRLAPKWVLTIGGRIDYDTYGGFQPAGRAALSYEINKTSMLYTAVSRAYHMPPAARRFLNFPIADPLLHITNAQDVGAESLVAYELGYRGRYFDRLDVGLNTFWNSYDDVITNHFALGPPGLFQMKGDNGMSLSTYGVEADAKYALTDALTLLANYTFEQPDSAAIVGQTDDVSMPRHKFMTGIWYDLTKSLHLSAHLYFVDHVQARTGGLPFVPTQIPEYYRLDLRAEQSFWEDRASLAVGVRNLLDAHHPEGGSASLDFAEVPRMVYAELRVRLK